MIRRMTMLCMVLMLLLVCTAQAEPEGMAHYLLVGVDGWGVSVEGGARSDAIILASLDYDNDSIALTSFARDMLVEPVHRQGMTKINMLVRAQVGEQALRDYIEQTFGVPISGYFIINFSGAVDLIDAIGGVDIELTEEETGYLRHYAGDYDGYVLHSGLCRLNGAQALAYMRCRHLDSDFVRQQRQRNVLEAVLEELDGVTPLRAIRLFGAIWGMYRCDMTIREQLVLAKNLTKLEGASTHMHAIPAEGTFRYGESQGGIHGIEFDLEENKALLGKWLGIGVLGEEEME